jgi:hypothetical protein
MTSFQRCVGASSLRPASQGVEQVSIEVCAKPVRVELADEVGAHFQDLHTSGESAELRLGRPLCEGSY